MKFRLGWLYLTTWKGTNISAWAKPTGSHIALPWLATGARFDASQLWGGMLRKREIGYQSPLYHTVVNGLTSFSGLTLLVLHFSVVGAAIWTAFEAARPLGFSFPFFLSLTAALSFLATVTLFLVGFFVPAPYRASKELHEHWRRNQGQDSPEQIAPPKG